MGYNTSRVSDEGWRVAAAGEAVVLGVFRSPFPAGDGVLDTSYYAAGYVAVVGVRARAESWGSVTKPGFNPECCYLDNT